jgi:hypothetical protein
LGLRRAAALPRAVANGRAAAPLGLPSLPELRWVLADFQQKQPDY